MNKTFRGAVLIKNSVVKCQLCFVRGLSKNSCLVAGIVSFHIVGLHLRTLRNLESYPSH